MKQFLKHIIVTVLTWEARLVLRKYRPHIVAVTGSVGKTSTKDAIFSTLKQSASARKSEKSFNSELGVPLTVLGAPNAWSNPLRWLQNIVDGLFLILFNAPYPDWLVLEVGADRPGDISSLASWLSVDVAVITRLPEVPVHVEFFESPEAVVAEKASLINAVKPGGTVVAYGDDARAMVLLEKAHERGLTAITFGTTPIADVRASDLAFIFETGNETWPIGMECTVTAEGSSVPVRVIGAVGGHMLFSTLACAGVAKALGRNLSEVSSGIAAYTPPPGRMRLVRGIKDTLIIDDTYNSSPAAAAAALDTLAALQPHMRGKGKGRTIAALGDMLELGRHSVEEHRKLGALVAKSADILLTVGFRSRDIAQGALDAGMEDGKIFQYEDSKAAGAELQNMLQDGDCVLVKGSQSMRMERIVEEVMAEPERASELLVRQDAEWKKR